MTLISVRGKKQEAHWLQIWPDEAIVSICEQWLYWAILSSEYSSSWNMVSKIIGNHM